MALYFKQLELGPMQNFVYLIGDPASKEAAVIDPAWNARAILQQLDQDGYHLTHILLSHGHYDHINGVEEILKKVDATVCAQAVEMDEFIPSGAGGLVIPRSSLKKTSHEQVLRIGEIEVALIPTPGHTPGSQCILIRNPALPAELLITGDTLFVGTCGRCDLPYSNPEELYQSLCKLRKLSDTTIFYPGHDYGMTPSNTLQNEKKTNPFLLCQSLDQFLDMVHR